MCSFVSCIFLSSSPYFPVQRFFICMSAATVVHSVLYTACLPYTMWYLWCVQEWLRVYLLLFITGITFESLGAHSHISAQLFIGAAELMQPGKESILSSREKGGRGGTHEDFSRPQYLWNSAFQKHHGVYPYIFHCACSERQWELFMWSKKRER